MAQQDRSTLRQTRSVAVAREPLCLSGRRAFNRRRVCNTWERARARAPCRVFADAWAGAHTRVAASRSRVACHACGSVRLLASLALETVPVLRAWTPGKRVLD